MKKMLKCPKSSTTNNDEKAKLSKGAVGGMLIVNCVPIVGLIAAFLWARAKLKNAKIKLASISILLLAINVGITLSVYTFSIYLMKNSLSKAVENCPITAVPSSDAINPMQNVMDMGMSGVMGQFGGGYPVYNMDDYTQPNLEDPYGGYNPEPSFDLDEMMKTDDKGNTYYDTDGDGKYDILIDSDGGFFYDMDKDGVFETDAQQWGN